MRVATFNILHGRSLSDGRVEPERLRSAIQALAPDVLGLQEVDHVQPRSGSVDLTGLAADAMGAIAHRFTAALVGTPGQVWRAASDADVPDTAAYGVSLLSRHAVREWRVIRLASAPVTVPLRVGPAGHRRWVLVRDEPRVGLAAVLETPLGRLSVVNTHLSFVPAWNRMQLRRLLAALRQLPPPYLLMGDLNMAVPRQLRRWASLARARTFPADAPRQQIDHLLWHGEPAPRVLASDAPRLPLSDHRALVADLAR